MSASSTNYTGYLLRTEVQQGDIWDEHRIVETYHVEKTEPPAVPPVYNPVTGKEPTLILADTGTPVILSVGDPYQGGTGTTWMDSALVRSIDWTIAEGRGVSCRVTYSTRYFYAEDAKGLATTEEDLANAAALSPGLFLPAMVIPSFRTRSMKLYRDDPGMTVPNASNDSSLSDIGGVAKPRSVDVRQVGMKLRMYTDSTSSSLVDMIAVAQQWSGLRNDSEFLGYTQGKLVIDGVSINHLEHEMYEFVFDILFDEYFHHSQVPQLGTDGRPKMDGADYLDVRWQREKRTEADFNDLWPSGDLGLSQKYQAYKGVWY